MAEVLRYGLGSLGLLLMFFWLFVYERMNDCQIGFIIHLNKINVCLVLAPSKFFFSFS